VLVVAGRPVSAGCSLRATDIRTRMCRARSREIHICYGTMSLLGADVIRLRDSRIKTSAWLTWFPGRSSPGIANMPASQPPIDARFSIRSAFDIILLLLSPPRRVSDKYLIISRSFRDVSAMCCCIGEIVHLQNLKFARVAFAFAFAFLRCSIHQRRIENRRVIVVLLYYYRVIAPFYSIVDATGLDRSRERESCVQSRDLVQKLQLAISLAVRVLFNQSSGFN